MYNSLLLYVRFKLFKPGTCDNLSTRDMLKYTEAEKIMQLFFKQRCQVGIKCYDIYRKVLIIPMGFTQNIVIKKLKEIHFLSEIIAVPAREERIHIGCLPFAWASRSVHG